MRRTLAALAVAMALPATGLLAPPVRAQVVVVREGDTLSDIAARHQVSLTRLMQANGISDPDLVVVGQRLTIPGGSARSAASGSGGGSVTVQPGDTLSDIAVRHGVGVTRLMQANGISDADLVMVGQRLTIPGGSGRSAAPAPPSAQPTAPYTVKSGETLSEIAARFNTSTERLIQLNRIQNPDLLTSGTRLRIPMAPRSSAAPASAPAARPVPNRNAREHVVQGGESLSGIAERYGTSVSQLVALNRIEDPDRLLAGTRLQLRGTPPAAQSTPAAQPKPASQTQPAAKVQPAAQAQPAVEATPQPAATAEPEPQPQPATATATPATATPAGAPATQAGPAGTAPSEAEPAAAATAAPSPRPQAQPQPEPQPQTVARPQPRPASTPARATTATTATTAAATTAAAASAAAAAPATAARSSASSATSAARTTASATRAAAAAPTTQSTALQQASARSSTASTAASRIGAATGGVQASAARTAATTPSTTPAAATTAARPAPASTATSSGAASAGDWRSYGPLQIDWSKWQAMGGSHVAPSLNSDGKARYLAVNCTARKLNRTTASGQWDSWESPQEDFETKLVQDICREKDN
jgi:LysM repeat protein